MSLQLSSPLTNPNSEEEVNIILSGNAAQPIILELLGQASALQVSNQHQQQSLASATANPGTTTPQWGL
jgi:hypothetical protein